MPMSWELDAEHRDFQAVCRTFVDRHARPAVGEAEALGRVPRQLWKELGAAGLLGLLTPEEYGGSGGDQLAVALLAEELARASGGIAISPLVSAYMAAPHIAVYGSAEQRAAYLPGLARGESIAALAVTEPDAGSDVAAIATSAVRDGTGWRLNGRKMFITNAGLADVLIVAAKTAPDAGRRGISTFLVEAAAPGLSLGEPLPKMGWHAADTREVILDDVVVPATSLLGELNRGFYQIMHAFQLERVALTAMGLGHAAECLHLATGHARVREAFGAPLAGLQSVRHRLAEMAVELESARLMTYHAAQRLGAGHPQAPRSVAMAKYHTALAAGRIVDAAVQIFGGSGYIEESAVARHYRDVRVLRIGGGADEIQLEILSRELTP
jgi:acyl-CoA dehydrogenase